MIIIISICLTLSLVSIGTQASFSDIENSSGNKFTAGFWVYTIVATSSTGGSIDPNGTIGVKEGEDQHFTITSGQGYRIEDVLVDGVSIGDANSYKFENVTGNHTIHAEFLKQYSLTIESSADGSVTTPGEDTFDYDTGTVVSLEAVASEGFEFTEWTGDVDSIADVNSSITTITMFDDYSITANFEAITQDYELSISSTSGGQVITPGEGSYTYSSGTLVNLIAEVDGRSEFEGWTGDTATITDPSDLVTTIEILDNYTIEAEFSNIIIIGAKDISVSGELILTARFHPGGINRAQWYIDGVGQGEKTGFGDSDQFTFEPDEAGTYVVEFRIYQHNKPDEYQSKSVTIIVTDNSIQAMTKAETSTFTITATSGEEGSISDEGENAINTGEDKTFTIIPTEGFNIEDVIVDGGSIGAVSEYTFTNISADHTIHAIFSPIDNSTVTITFDANGGEPQIQTKEVELGSKAGSLPEVFWESHVFKGWNTHADGSGEDFGSETEVTRDFIVYAQWRGEESSTEEENDDNPDQ